MRLSESEQYFFATAEESSDANAVGFDGFLSPFLILEMYDESYRIAFEISAALTDSAENSRFIFSQNDEKSKLSCFISAASSR